MSEEERDERIDAWHAVWARIKLYSPKFADREESGLECVLKWVDDHAGLQAKIDALMLEYCPDEMTSEQIEAWGKRQRPVSPEKEAEINNILGIEKKE